MKRTFLCLTVCFLLVGCVLMLGACGGEPPHEHTFGAWESVDAETHRKTCTAGDETVTEAHDFAAPVVVTEATVSSTGEQTRTCRSCGYVKTETIEKLPHEHQYSENAEPLDSDCHAYHCTVEGCDAFRSEEHSLGSATVTKEPTLTEEGVSTRTCLVCGMKNDTPIPVLEPHTVTFRADGKTVATVTIGHGQLPSYPSDAPLPTKPGYANFFWLNMDQPITEDTVIDALFFHSNPEAMEIALSLDLLTYADPAKDNDNSVRTMSQSSALLYMLLEEHSSPQAGVLRDRVLEHIRNLISGGQEPYFECESNWSYPIVTAALAIAKQTPSVWEQLTAAEIERIDCLMRSYTYICAFATDDDNNYLTGPRLRGNFSKEWNPNYRLGSVMPIFFCVSYFGGADQVNALIANFDYDTVIADYRKYGFTRSLECWTTEGFLLNDGVTMAPGAKELLSGGGKAYIKTPANSSLTRGDSAGSGVGVAAGGSYTYKGYTLDQLPAIFNTLLAYCYSGGIVTNDWYNGSEKAAYIMDGTDSVMLGYAGMMLEFNTNGRSSLSYTSKDFLMVASAMSALKTLGIYDIEAKENLSVWRLVYVGNTDTIYKADHGYFSYASTGIKPYYAVNCADAYLIWAADWKAQYGDIPAFIESLGLTKKEIPESTIKYATGASSSDLTVSYRAQSASAVAGGKNWYENDFLYSVTIRYDESLCTFGVRLREGSNRTDLFKISKDGIAVIETVSKLNLPMLTPIDASPVLIPFGEYGWHRVGFRYHETVEVDETAKTATCVPIISVYMDGVLVGSYRGATTTFDSYNWWLFRAQYDESAEGHVAYLPANGDPYWQLYRTDAYFKGSWFFEYMDDKVSCGANFDVNVIPVAYVLNGGEFKQTDVIDAGGALDGIATSYDASLVWYFYSDARPFSLATPERDGYTFTGWFTNAECKGDAVDPEMFVPLGDTVTLYAGWTKNP